MTCALRYVECEGPASERLLRALAPFGLLVQRTASRSQPKADANDVQQLLAMPNASIVLLTGPSGCGKSTLLRAVTTEARRRGVRVVDASALLRRAAEDRPIIDLFTLSLLGTLRLLSSAGLGEAMLWARSAAELSEGQHARLGIALAMARASARNDTLIVSDEFCSTLDRVTARGVAQMLRRWCSAQPHARVLCATAHDDLTSPLAPDLVLCPGSKEDTP